MKNLIPSAFALALLTSTAGSALAQGGPGQVEVNLDGLAQAIESRSEPGQRQEAPRFEAPPPMPQAPAPQIEARREDGERAPQGEPRWNREREPQAPGFEPDGGRARPDAPRFDPPVSVPTSVLPQDRRRHDDGEHVPQSEDRGRHGDGGIYVPPTRQPQVVTQPPPQPLPPQARPGERGRTDRDRDRHPGGDPRGHGADRGRDRHHYDDRSWSHDSGGQDRDWQWRDNRDWQWRDNNNGYRDWGGSRRPYYSPHRYRGWTYRAPYGFYDHNWRYGETLPQAWWAPNYRITDWWNFGLPRPPVGYQWVRVGDDAFLVDRFNGRVIQIVYDLFW